MKLTDDRNGSKITKSKRFCAIKGDTYDFSIGAPLQTLGAPITPLWIVHSGVAVCDTPSITYKLNARGLGLLFIFDICKI